MAKKLLDIEKLDESFIRRAQGVDKLPIAVVHPCSQDSLTGAVEAAQLGIIEPILVGPKEKIVALATEFDIKIDNYEIVDVKHSHDSVERSISLIHAGRAKALMKGSLHTDELMKGVLSKSTGLRTERRISHIFLMARETYHKPFIITDAAININPDLMTKRDILQNAIDVMHILYPDLMPKVGILSAIEMINPNIQSTIDAACLCKMAQRDQIRGAIVDGPFAYDNILSVKAAKTKNISSPVIGDVDIYLVPNLEAGNMLAKQLVYLTDAWSAGMLLGAQVPIILTSRSDGVRSRISSCVIAALMAQAKTILK